MGGQAHVHQVPSRCQDCLQDLRSPQEQRLRSFSLERWLRVRGQESSAGFGGSQAGGKDPNGGRRLSSQGRRDLDRIAAQLKVADAKKAAAALAVSLAATV